MEGSRNEQRFLSIVHQNSETNDLHFSRAEKIYYSQQLPDVRNILLWRITSARIIIQDLGGMTFLHFQIHFFSFTSKSYWPSK